MPLASTVRAGEAQVVVVQGEVDLLTAPELRAALQDALTSSRFVVVDLAGCDFLDARGLRVLADAWQQAADAGGWLRLCSIGPMIARIVAIGALDALVEPYPTRKSALTGLEV